MTPRPIDPLTRIDKDENDCWLWTGPLDEHGYGRHGTAHAHRLIYELTTGEIPRGLELDHLCSVRRCVNPAHLEPVTHAENVRRGRAGQVNGDRQRSLTHCKRGHEFSAENTRIDGRGHRSCRACMKYLHQLYRAQRKASK